MTLEQAKKIANNTEFLIRPILGFDEDGEQQFSLYAFYVRNNTLYDTKEKLEREENWNEIEFCVE